MIVPLLLLVVCEAAMFAVVLFVSGMPSRLVNSDKVFFDGQVRARAHFVESALAASREDAFPMTGEEARSILPDEELGYETDAFYLVCTGEEVLPDDLPQGELTVQISSGRGYGTASPAAGERIHLRRGDDGGDLLLVAAGEPFHVTGEVIHIEALSARGQSVCLLGAVKSEALYRYSTRIKRLMTLTILLILLTGALGAVLIARKVSRPIAVLSEEILVSRHEKKDIPRFSRTGITEIDQFAGTITAMARDMDRQRLLEKKRIEHERDYDSLTGLMNQSAFVLSCARIFSTPDFIGHAAVLMLDLDDVKLINDTYGHAAGDAYISLAAKTFSDSAPPNALISKVAGDEFYILYYGFETEEALEEQIDVLRRAIASADVFLPGGEKGELKITGGVAKYPQDGRSHTELMKAAEFQAYHTKRGDKGRIVNFERESFVTSAAEMKRREDMRAILKDHRLVGYSFMPIFSAKTGEVVAYEALMRANREHLKYPVDILELARQEKVLPEIERIVWERGLQCYSELLREGKAEEHALLLLNSIANVCLPEEEMAEIAEQHRELMGRVVIEITESELMDEEATRRKRMIPGFSGRFALDDYGSGYNSEKTLLELSPTYIKADLSIIRNIDSSPDKQRIISNIVQYAHEREMFIIAEGVESPSEMQTVCELGVDYLQGFYLARDGKVPPPLSHEASEFLDRRHTEGYHT